MAADTIYDSDHDTCQEELVIQRNMVGGEPVLCWGRGLRKPKISDIPHYKSLSLLTLKEKSTSKSSSGRGRGASYKSKFLNQFTVGERISPATNAEDNEVSLLKLPQFENTDENALLLHLQQNESAYENGSSLQLQQYENADDNDITCISDNCNLVQCLPENNATNCLDNTTMHSAELGLPSNFLRNANIFSFSNHHDPSHGLPESNARNFLDNATSESARLSSKSSSNISTSICLSSISNNHDLCQCLPVNNASNCRDNTTKDFSRLSSNSSSNASICSISNNHDVSQCENNDSNSLDIVTRCSARLPFQFSSSSNASVSSMDSSKASEQEGKTTSPVCEMAPSDNPPFNDNSSTASNFVKKAKCNKVNIRGGRAVHKKTNLRRNQHLTKTSEKQTTTCVGEPDTNTGSPSIKRYSLSKKSKKKEILKDCYTGNISSQSGSETSSTESNHEADDRFRWGSVNFNKASNKESQKQKWVEGDFPLLGSESAYTSMSKRKTSQHKKTQGLNLKSVAESLLQPLSGSVTESSSGEKDSPPPQFLRHLTTSDKKYFTIKFAVENIPGFLEESAVREVLEPYGDIVDLRLNPCRGGDALSADVTMKSECELKEIIGHLNDTSPFGASSQNLKVYLL